MKDFNALLELLRGNARLIREKIKEPSREIKLVSSETAFKAVNAYLNAANEKIKKHNERRKSKEDKKQNEQKRRKKKKKKTR